MSIVPYRSSTIMVIPILPVELINAVLSLLYKQDPSALKSCMQVSRVWHSAAKPWHFRGVTLHYGNALDLELCLERAVVRLHYIFQADPSIPTYVRSLSLTTTSNESCYILPKDKLLADTLNKMCNLKDIELELYGNSWWASANPSVRSAFTHLLSLPSLRSLRLQDCGDLPVPLWIHHPTLEELVILLSPSPSLEGAKEADCAKIGFLRCTVDELELVLIKYPGLLRHLHTAECVMSGGTSWAIQGMIDATRGTLSSLTLDVYYSHFSRYSLTHPSSIYDFSQSRSLRSINLNYRYELARLHDLPSLVVIPCLSTIRQIPLEDLHVSLKPDTAYIGESTSHLRDFLQGLDGIIDSVATGSMRQLTLTIKNHSFKTNVSQLVLYTEAGTGWRRCLPNLASLVDRTSLNFKLSITSEGTLPFLPM